MRLHINTVHWLLHSETQPHLNDIRCTGELVLICTILQSTLVQEVYVHSFNQDEGAQVSAGQRNKPGIKNYRRN